MRPSLQEKSVHADLQRLWRTVSQGSRPAVEKRIVSDGPDPGSGDVRMRTVENQVARTGEASPGSAGPSGCCSNQVFSYTPRPVRLIRPSFDQRATTCLR